uniref:Small ribosomal subunit protein uS7m n=2 Tax=Drosophila melanogaster TaxID=7227 RepID=RT07_DROME|eukprot:NP_001260339.1 mitochondrial ribosomal protein S7, isoform B [Drosophila melanogaster]
MSLLGRIAEKTSRLSCLRLMSVYPTHYVEPIVQKYKQLEQKNDLSKLYHVPIKAAVNKSSDTIFHDDTKHKMINYITKKGNSALARTLLSKTLELIKRTQTEHMNLAKGEKTTINTNPETLLKQAVENCRPLLQVTAIKRGGVTYQVPVPITTKRSYFLAMKWLLEAAREKERKVSLPEKLAWEILDAAHGQGRVIKRKDDLHRLCESNRAYAHYRWS